MPTSKDRYVVKHGDGWAVKKGGAKRASAVKPTQREAEKRAKEIVKNQGGGEVRIQGRDRKFRDSDTVAPGRNLKWPIPPPQILLRTRSNDALNGMSAFGPKAVRQLSAFGSVKRSRMEALYRGQGK